MQKIIPTIWQKTQEDIESLEQLYTAAFPDFELLESHTMENVGPNLDMTITAKRFKIAGLVIDAFNGGPEFEPNPSISITVVCPINDIQNHWDKLVEGGKVLMDLEEYPWAKKYGWLEDKFGVSWQFMENEEDDLYQAYPSILFVNDVYGKAREAIDLYLKAFDNSEEISVSPGSEDSSTVGHAWIRLADTEIMLMDGEGKHEFKFTEGMSLTVLCDGQEEVDKFWNYFIDNGGEESMCGWLKDKFGVSWQIVPKEFEEMAYDEDKEKGDRVMRAMLEMNKLIVSELRDAYNGNS